MKRAKYLVAFLGLFLVACNQGIETSKTPDTPTPPPVQAVDGKALFERNCVVCHGTFGKGDGPASANLSTKPADLTSQAVQKKSDPDLKKIISEGTARGMPPWRHLSEAERDALVKYIRELGGRE